MKWKELLNFIGVLFSLASVEFPIFIQSWFKESQQKWLRLLVGKQPKNHKLFTDYY